MDSYVEFRSWISDGRHAWPSRHNFFAESLTAFWRGEAEFLYLVGDSWLARSVFQNFRADSWWLGSTANVVEFIS